MRIVHYIDHIDFRRGGPARAVVDQVRVMCDRGHRVALASMSQPDVPEAWRTAAASGGSHAQAIELQAIGSRVLSARGAGSFRSLLGGADIVHLHGAWEPSNLQCASMARRAGVPVVISLRGMLDDWCMAQGGLKKRVYLMMGGRTMLEQATVIHCTAEAELAQSKKWFPKGRGIVVPNLMDLAPFRAMPGPKEAQARFSIDPSGPPIALFLSRMSPKKGVEHLIEAARLLGEEGRPLRVLVAGDGDADYAARMRALARTVPAPAMVEFVGHVGGSLKLSLLQASSLFVLPTSQENFGFVFFEALAAGLPVLTTDLVDTRDEIVSSGGGEVVPQDAHHFAAAMKRLLSDPSALEARGNAGREWVLRELDTHAVAARFERLYEVALGAAARA